MNPAAGSGKGLKIWPKLQRELRKQGVEHQVAFSDAPGVIAKLTQQFVKNGYRKFAVVGGDGTLNELINGLFNQSLVAPNKLAVASIPIGTGNDWIRSHYPNASHSEIIGMMQNGRFTFQDVGVIADSSGRTTYFGNVAEFGFGGLVVERLQRLKRFRLGRTAYLAGLVLGLFQYRPTQVQLKFNQDKVEKSLFNLVVAIGGYAGGGMNVAPEAITDDGLLDLTLIEPINPLKALVDIAKLFNGTFVNLPEISTFQTPEVSIRTVVKIVAEVDGEVVGLGREFEVSIISKALRVLSP